MITDWLFESMEIIDWWLGTIVITDWSLWIVVITDWDVGKQWESLIGQCDHWLDAEKQ